jgi:hypothetical protein
VSDLGGMLLTFRSCGASLYYLPYGVADTIYKLGFLHIGNRRTAAHYISVLQCNFQRSITHLFRKRLPKDFTDGETHLQFLVGFPNRFPIFLLPPVVTIFAKVTTRLAVKQEQ